ncbi:MAG: hypothetical protein Q4D26_04940 [Clostridia bacterium]|nr:hypothetical protein [Clostridia bacterium]
MDTNEQYNIKFPKLTDIIFKYRYVLAGIIFIFAVILKLSGSSVGVWCQAMWGKNSNNIYTVFGTPRSIRSDEYAVNLPLMISQCKNGFPYFSEVLRGTVTDMFMVYGQPVLDIAVLFRPFHWGYLLLGAERGLSFFWYGRLITLFLVSFEFGRLITEDKRGLSFALAVLITGSPVVQWWYAVNYLVELLIFGMLAILLINSYMKSEDLKVRIMSMIGVSICVGGYCFSLYPAWQIPLAYIFSTIAIYYIFKNIKERKWNISDAVILTIAVLFTGAMVIRVVIKSWDTIQIVMNTAYPGGRLARGGTAKTALFKYVISLFLPFDNVGIPTNVCEEAMTFDFFPLCYILPLWLLIKEKRKDGLTVIMLVVALFFNIWLLFKMPVWYAKITLMSNVPANRCAMVIGFLNLFLLFRVLSFKEIKWRLLTSVLLSAVSAGLCIYFVFLYMPDYMAEKRVIFCVLFLIVSVFILTQHIKKNTENIVILCSIIGIVSLVFVNPVEKGLNIVFDDGVLHEIAKIDEEDSGLWIVEGAGYPVNNYPVMAGINMLNNTATYPDLEAWHKIDSSGEYEEVYNRYAHIVIKLKKEGRSDFELLNADMFSINMNVNDLEKYNVKYVFTWSKLENMENENVAFEKLYTKGSWNIYKVLYN